ncbi:hypothetical protein EMIHUDRAFT_259376 [Emiliania huxleyi CCMP1516]|uniref:Uncharacterized protein n=2 Tax=Emiliania huxleyi TaxID=2903 RepID=A0A0D3I1B0_EMIH1|nr:hypothetical protein EMIHUDRAFT_259376 [Emiliania huxleyi CCMP1516]EOD05045.1 hypothetical protein EMIHUDRAFT_259376 [Emiliania huxleyi CCMP1516]|eukprot:XP_005757474.1 hypothetical protein EMIHUDRAFT_259376 [Emiliania huxleyi CCMP1516]
MSLSSGGWYKLGWMWSMKASISAAVTSSGASTGCKAVDRTAGRLRQDWRVADDEPKQKGLHDGKPGCILAPGRRSCASARQSYAWERRSNWNSPRRELQPEPALLASSETIPTRAQMRMQRWPGKRSYCHTIGRGCGGPQHRQAWEELSTELDHNARALALHFVDDQCKDLPPERRAASARFVELLLTTGLELLCSVASKLHSLEVEQCWAWCAR